MDKVGLILEGGAMRGLYTAGVIDTLIKNEIKFTTTIGVSAGAAFGCNYKSKQIKRAHDYIIKYADDQRYVGLKSLITTGNLYNTEFAYYQVPYVEYPFDTKTYAADPSEFYLVATEVDTAQAVYQEIKKGDLDEIDWFRASASMPLVSKPVEISGSKYLDGGISDSIPIKWMETNKCQKNVVVLTQVKDYVKKESNPFFLNLLLRKYPQINRALAKRADRYNATIKYINEQEAAGNTFVIQPSQELNIKRIEKDKDKLEAIYQLGVADTEAKLIALKNFMKEE